MALAFVPDYDDQWSEPSKEFAIPDGHGGTLLVLTNTVICNMYDGCGALADQRISYTWKGTKSPGLLEMRLGASVKHYYTQCREHKEHCTVS